LRVRAKANDGEVRFFADDAEPLDRAIEKVSAGLRIHLSPGVTEVDVLKARLKPQATGGAVNFVAAFPGGREVEVRLPGKYQLDPAMRGALKIAPGVALLEDV
jgi:DNA polymerase-3 subunit alpha